MDIYLVRHGEAAASWGQAPDPGLSETGRQQAREAARILQGRLAGGVQLFSSPLARAMETAAPLATALDLPIQINEAFSEIRSPVPLQQRQAWLRQFMQQRWREQAPELHQWREGVLAGLLRIRAPAVVFTHFLVINALVGQILQVDKTLCFWPDNGSITHLRLRRGVPELVELGAQMPSLVN